MKINFDTKINEIIKILALEAERFGVKIYFVGGLVRDVLMGKNPLDIDILVEGNAVDFINSLSPDFIRVKSVHMDFATVKTQIQGFDIDFASTRIESYPQSGCLPVVKKIGCKIEEDLIRRDFTINAIAARILPELNYEILDLCGGSDDIKSATLRVLHKNSYIDDPTRILRGLDFKLRFGFDFSADDKKLIQEYLKAPNREGLSTDRVILTLKKLFFDKARAALAFEEFEKEKYYKILFDEFICNPSEIVGAIDIFHPEDIAQTYVKYIFEKPGLQKLNSRLEIYKYFRTLSREDLCVYFAKTHDNNAVLYFRELKDINVCISGTDLLNLGFAQGKIIGEILDDILLQKLNGNPEIASREDEIAYVEKNYTLV